MCPRSTQADKRRKHLAGIEQAAAVEGAFQPLLLRQIGFGEHRRHQVALLDADAMLAGQHAADLDAEPQDVGAERFGAVELARLHHIEDDQRMQIAVAGVEHVAETEPVFLRHLGHARQHLRQGAARDGAVHAQHVGRQPPHRAENAALRPAHSRARSASSVASRTSAPLPRAISPMRAMA